MPQTVGETAEKKPATLSREALNVSCNSFSEVDAVSDELELSDPGLGSLFDKAFALPPPPMPSELLGAE